MKDSFKFFSGYLKANFKGLSFKAFIKDSFDSRILNKIFIHSDLYHL